MLSHNRENVVAADRPARAGANPGAGPRVEGLIELCQDIIAMLALVAMAYGAMALGFVVTP